MTSLLTLAQYRMDYYGDHMDRGWGWGMAVLMAVLVVAVVVLVVWAVRSLSARGPHVAPSGGPTAKDILDRRLAQGEITPDEYRERLTLLGSG